MPQSPIHTKPVSKWVNKRRVGHLDRLREADWAVQVSVVATAAEGIPPSALAYDEEGYGALGFGGIPASTMDIFLGRLGEDAPSFMQGWTDADEVAAFAADIRGEGSAALARLSPELAAFLVAGVGLVADRVEVQAIVGADSGDIIIHREGLVEGDKGTEENKLFNAARRWSPAFWRNAEHGKAMRGSGAHILLAVWTTACRHAVDYLHRLDTRSSLKGDVQFTTGYAFVKDKVVVNDDVEVIEHVDSLHKNVDGVHALLLNPILNNGEPAYDIETEGGDPDAELKGLSDMLANAWVEATKILCNPQDREYTAILAKMMAGFARQDIQRSMRASAQEAINATRAAYGRGECRIQALEVADVKFDPVFTEDSDVRPADRLLALAAPATMLVLGTAKSPDNAAAADEEVPEILAFIDACIARERASETAPEVRTVDCDALAALEAGLSVVIQNQPVLLADIEASPVPAEASISLPIVSADIETGAQAPASAVVEPVVEPVLLPLTIPSPVEEMPAAPEPSAKPVAAAESPVSETSVPVLSALTEVVAEAMSPATAPTAEPVASHDDAPAGEVLTVDLSALDIGGAKTRPAPVKIAKVGVPEGVAPSVLLSMLGEGQGRFTSSARSPASPGADKNITRDRIELAKGGLAGLIQRGGFNGLANRIKAAAGDTSTLPDVVVEVAGELVEGNHLEQTPQEAVKENPQAAPALADVQPHAHDILPPAQILHIDADDFDADKFHAVFGKQLPAANPGEHDAEPLVGDDLDFDALDADEDEVDAPGPAFAP